MEAMTVQELLEATGGKLLAGSKDQTITAVETDSRAILEVVEKVTAMFYNY